MNIMEKNNKKSLLTPGKHPHGCGLCLAHCPGSCRDESICHSQKTACQKRDPQKNLSVATILTLALIPCLLTIVNDMRYAYTRLSGRTDMARNVLEPAFRRGMDANPNQQIVVTANGANL